MIWTIVKLQNNLKCSKIKKIAIFLQNQNFLMYL